MSKNISNIHILYDKSHGTSNLVIGLIGPFIMELDISDAGNPWIFGKNTFNRGKFSMGYAHLYCVLV